VNSQQNFVKLAEKPPKGLATLPFSHDIQTLGASFSGLMKFKATSFEFCGRKLFFSFFLAMPGTQD
jgi:hypothetical protein